MIYKIVEMKITAYYYKTDEREKERFITSFQNKVNEFLNNGYVPSGGICISQPGLSGDSIGDVLFAQALIKE